MSLKKPKSNDAKNCKLNIIERKIYNSTYSVIEKLLITCYEMYVNLCKEFGYDNYQILSYEDYGKYINEQLGLKKGD